MNRISELKKYAQAAMNLATNFEPVGATQQLVMSDERDFSRPISEFYSSITPDLSSADDAEKPKVSPDDAIKQFQAYFGQEQTGVVDDKLIAAAKSIEDKIAKATNNSAVKGLLWANGKFNTTVNDVQTAMQKLQQLQSVKSSDEVAKL